jgi:hypothetical protein
MYHAGRAFRSAVVRERPSYVPAACPLSVGGHGSGFRQTPDRSGDPDQMMALAEE